MCITIRNISYLHPDKEVLFRHISFTVQQHKKVSVIGNNGIGKSTLLKIISGELAPSSGKITTSSKPYYIPQHFGQYDNYTVADALGVNQKIYSLFKILEGDSSPEYWNILNEDWKIEEKCYKALSFWNLPKITLEEKLCNLSGGEKTKVFLAGIRIHKPKIVLYDEPTNHLDLESRRLFYTNLLSENTTSILVSHDRTLLEMMQYTYELNSESIKQYGGNYSFYKNQIETESKALEQQLENKEKELKKAKKIKQEAFERKQRLDNRGKKKHHKMNTPRSMLKKLKNDAESSSTKQKDTHVKKIEKISRELSDYRLKVSKYKVMKIDFDDSNLHPGKVLVSADKINFSYSSTYLWCEHLSFEIRSGGRINLKGCNGSGKTTLVKIILGELKPSQGIIRSFGYSSVYIDQDYSMIDNKLSVYEQALKYNLDHLEEHEIKIRLNRFLFHAGFWNTPCQNLSGGEKMRLILCCLMISNHSPDMFILDEPTNNLDIQNIHILTTAIKDYSGSLIVISHDSYFLDEIGISEVFDLDEFL